MELEVGELEPAKIYYDRIEGFFQAHPGLKRINIVYEEIVECPEEHI